MKIKIITLLAPILFSGVTVDAQKSVRDSLKSFTINVVQKSMEKGKIKKIAVWDFTDMNKEVSVFGSYIAEQFSVYAESVDSIELMDRQNLKSLLNEHQLKSEGFIDKNTIMQLGKFKEVDAVAVGSVIMADKNFQVVVKIIETSFGRTMAADEQFFEIDKNMASILGIGYSESSSGASSLNTPNRGFNKPLNASEQYNNSSTVNKSCEQNNTGDFCFFNGTKARVKVTLFIVDQKATTGNWGPTMVSWAQDITIDPGQTQCYSNLVATNYGYKIQAVSTGWTRTMDEVNGDRKGNVVVEKCRSKTYSIR